MNETTAAGRSVSEPPEALVKRRHGISVVWAIPIVAALIGAFLAYKAYTGQGPTISISFQTAEGLEAGKTKIRFLDVEVGTVQSVVIGGDLKHIMVTAQMAPGADTYLRADTEFWIVKPRIGVGGVSGLGTLLSGAYIGLNPGQGDSARDFVGLEEPPPISANVPGREFVLTTPSLGSLSSGAPIYYRGIDIGQVMTYSLNEDATELEVTVFVKEAYQNLIRTRSRFWNASGIDVGTSASGIDVQIASLQALLVGGIEVDTPPGLEQAAVAEAGARFPLYANQRALAQAQFTDKIPYLIHFDGSVRGLNPGAPVEFRGITVGTVTSVQLEFDPATSRIRIPVTIEIEPQRIVPSASALKEVEPGKPMAELVAHGLRAQLQTGNLLTGELFVDLVLVPDAPKAELITTGPVPEIPSIPATLDQLQASATAILNKIAKLPLEELIASLSRTADGLEQIVTSPDVREAGKRIGPTIVQLQQTIGRLDAATGPLLGSVTGAANAATATLRDAQTAIASIQRTIGSGSPLAGNAENMMQELTRAARSIRVLADYLERNPQALLRGKSGGANP